METTQSYERAVEQHENERLTYYTKKSSSEQAVREDGKLFLNMSLKQIIQGISRTIIDIIDEIVSGKVDSWRQLLVTIFRHDRMIYIGTLLVIVAFAIYIVDITS